MTLFSMLIRQRLRDAWSRRSGLAALALYLSAVELLLLAMRYGLRLFRPGAAGLTGWIYCVGILLGLCVIALGFRWFRRVLMWRLRNRLIVTYVFIGVIPVVLLVAIGLIAGYLFAGQFATFVVTSDLAGQLKGLEAANRTAAQTLVSQLSAGVPIEKAAQSIRLDVHQRTMTVWTSRANDQAMAYVVPPNTTASSLPPKGQPETASAIVGDAAGIYLRVWTTVQAGSRKLVVIATEPLDKDLLARMVADLGEVRLNPPDFRQPERPASPATISEDSSAAGPEGSSDGQQRAPGAAKSAPRKDSNTGSIVIHGDTGAVMVQSPTTGEMVLTLPAINAGTLRPPKGAWDSEVWFGMPFRVMDWNNGETTKTLLGVRTRPSLLYGRLFMALGDFAGLIFILLAAVAIFFALIELAALITGIRLTRTMTRSVASLYRATEHINQGDFSHRIKVKSQDQLAALETSFNSMTDSLEKLIAEQKEKQRMESELAIAQEVQAQLFPRQLSDLVSLEVHGVCRPARTVSGDYYDFLALGPDKMGIAVGDISGKGISAALLMATIHSAVRVYEFGRMPSRQELMAAGAAAASAAGGGSSVMAAGAIQSPAAVLELLNRHLFHSTPPEKYATLFLALWQGGRHQLVYSNGGHLPPLVIGADGTLRKLETGGMVIGLFDEMQWDEGKAELRPGDLFVAYSDGITEPENEFGEFGEHRLIELVMENRHLPLARISEEVIASVQDWIGATEQPDDVTLVLARAR